MKSDIEISKENKMDYLFNIFEPLGIKEDVDYDCYGSYKAKVTEKCFETTKNNREGKLVLVTATSPSPAGEGKTTTTIGLVDGLNKIGIKAIGALREPSMGPVFGVKGGACGGGYAQVQPMEDINLHFTGDFHAITSANNLLCAIVDNSIKFGNPWNVDISTIKIKRCLDINDRELRNCVIGLGGSINGVPREEHFQITVASEIMAIVCLASSIQDLKKRLGNIIIGYNTKGEELYARYFECVGSLAVILKDAIRPNLVQTLEHNPIIIHGGPFANIAHGCNSIRATKLAMKLGEITVTEAGFGADLGAEKFIDIKCRMNEIKPDCIVLVSTIRALKYNGGSDKNCLTSSNINALMNGLNTNFIKHYNNLKSFRVPVVVAFNQFESDSEDEINCVKNFCGMNGITFSFNTSFKDGGEGAIELANKVKEVVKIDSSIKFLYDLNESLGDKISRVAMYYGANKVIYSSKAKKFLEKNNDSVFPICVAKTQYSFSDDPKILGAPKDFTITVSDISLSNGAEFFIVYLGDILTMPALPSCPAALKIDLTDDGEIIGLF